MKLARRLLRGALAMTTLLLLQAAAAQAKLIADYKERIKAKIQRLITLPQNIQGNPEAEFDVVLLPDGNPLQVKLKRTSGNASASLSAPAATRAVYSPREWPAAATGMSPVSATKARQQAMPAVSMTGWVLVVRSSCSFGPNNTCSTC